MSDAPFEAYQFRVPATTDPVTHAIVRDLLDQLGEYLVGGDPENLRYAARSLRALAVLDGIDLL